MPNVANLKNDALELLRFVGLLLAAQGVISQYFTGLGVPARILTAVFGGLGILSMVAGKYVDSKSYTTIQSAAALNSNWPPPAPPA